MTKKLKNLKKKTLVKVLRKQFKEIENLENRIAQLEIVLRTIYYECEHEVEDLKYL